MFSPVTGPRGTSFVIDAFIVARKIVGTIKIDKDPHLIIMLRVNYQVCVK